MTLTDEQVNLVLGALDFLGVALTDHDHQWTEGERAIYEEAMRIVGIETGESKGDGGQS